MIDINNSRVSNSVWNGLSVQLVVITNNVSVMVVKSYIIMNLILFILASLRNLEEEVFRSISSETLKCH